MTHFHFLTPGLIATIFMARMTLSTSYLCASYLCSQSKNTVLLKLCNTIRTALFCCDNFVLVGLLLNYSISTVLTLTYNADSYSDVLKNFGSFGLICFVLYVLNVALKGKLTCWFGAIITMFCGALVVWAAWSPSACVNICARLSSFGVLGAFLLLQYFGFSVSHILRDFFKWLALTQYLTKRLAFVDVWLGLPTDAQLLRNYAVLNLIQLNFVNLILADQEHLSFVTFSLTCLSAVPCLLLTFRHWNHMEALAVPTFGFVQILWESNKSALQLLVRQWKRNEAPCVKTSAFLGVFLCGLGFASPAHCASTELAILGPPSAPGELPEDTGDGVPVAESRTSARRISREWLEFGKDQFRRFCQNLRNAPSSLASNGIISGVSAAGGSAVSNIFVGGNEQSGAGESDADGSSTTGTREPSTTGDRSRVHSRAGQAGDDNVVVSGWWERKFPHPYDNQPGTVPPGRMRRILCRAGCPCCGNSRHAQD